MKILEISAESESMGPFTLTFNGEDADSCIVTLATFLGRAVP
jgi:hypothetical protein